MDYLLLFGSNFPIAMFFFPVMKHSNWKCPAKGLLDRTTMKVNLLNGRFPLPCLIARG